MTLTSTSTAVENKKPCSCSEKKALSTSTKLVGLVFTIAFWGLAIYGGYMAFKKIIK